MRIILMIVFVPLLNEACGTIQCGKRKIRPDFLMTNSPKVRDGYWPWHAAIYRTINGSFEYNCGGSIIDSNTILTAAHCVFVPNGLISKTNIVVHVGRTRLDDISERIQEHHVSMLIPHPDFDLKGVANDIALIKLTKNITMTDYIQPVCLWSMGDDLNWIIKNEGTVAGFGATEHNTTSNHLREATINVIDAWKCIESNRGIYGIHLTQGMICGKGSDGVTPCRGDSGGGLVFQKEWRWYVRGVVSFTSLDFVQSCDRLQYTVYTDVARYSDWIALYVELTSPWDESVQFIDKSPKLKYMNLDVCGITSDPAAHSDDVAHPWIGLVEFRWSRSRTEIRCQATLINEWYALSTANCFRSEHLTYLNKVKIVLGDFNKRYQPGCIDTDGTYLCGLPLKTVPIKEIIIHPNYNQTTFSDDIALIELREPADIKRSDINPICLPVTAELRSVWPSSLLVTSFDRNKLSINVAEARLINYTSCQNSYSSTQYPWVIDDSRFCTEFLHDSDNKTMPGTPIQTQQFFDGRERFVLRGIVLLDAKNTTMLPSMSVDTGKHLPWILHSIKEKGLPTASKNNSVTMRKGTNLLNFDTCGIIEQVESGKKSFQFPWIGVLERDATPSDIPEHLVTLISEWYALTSPIKEQDDDWGTVRLGDIDLLYNTSCVKDVLTFCSPPIQRIHVKRIIIHPQFNDADQSHYYVSRYETNGIALVEFLEPADITKPNVRPTCLPMASEFDRNKLALFRATYFSNTYFHRLMKAKYFPAESQVELDNVTIISYKNASDFCVIPEEIKTYNRWLPDVSLEAMQKSRGREKHFFMGMLKSFSNCVDDVTKYIDWILATMKDNELDIKNNREKVVQKISQRFERGTLISLENTTDLYNCGMLHDADHKPLDSSGSFPWIGFLHEDRRTEPLCQITLITKWFSLAPKRCFIDRDIQRYTVKLGGFGTSRVQELRIKPNTDELHSDIWMLQFEEPADIAQPNVKPICLPVFTDFLNFDSTDMMAVLFPRKGNSLVSLKSTVSGECLEQWVSPLPNGILCAQMDQPILGEECIEGLPGGTLQGVQRIGGRDQYFLLGISADASRSCTWNIPDVYVSIAKFLYAIIHHEGI